MAICPQLNCTYLETRGLEVGPPPLDADPDISGYGVLVGFTGTGFITLILLVIQYILDFIPDCQTNPIDRGVLNWLWKKTTRRPSPLWGHALEKSVLLMSDQQMVTGIAIMASGYFQLCAGDSNTGIASYDWQIVVYLAWFSSLTHLTTLTALRRYMVENPIIRIWRLLLMLIIVVMLVIALIPTMQLGWFYSSGFFNQYGGGAYAGCYYRSLGQPHYQADTNGLISLIISLIVLVAGYTSKTIKLFPRKSNSVRWFFRTVPGNWWKRRLDKLYRRSRQKHRRRCLASLYRIRYKWELSMMIVVRAFLDIYYSVVWEILWLLFGVAWGTLHLVSTKGGGTRTRGERRENEWGFGQFISTFLLALPLLNLAEACYETVGKLQKEAPLEEAHSSNLSPKNNNTTNPDVANPVAPQSSTTLVASQSPPPPINLHNLTFTTLTEETHIPKNTDDRSPFLDNGTPPKQRSSLQDPSSPTTDTNNLSLLYPLHYHNSYDFPWFRHLICAIILEAIVLGLLCVYLFNISPWEIDNIFIGLAPLWIEVFSVFPACVVYIYTSLSIREKREATTRDGQSVWKRPGLIALMAWKWILLVYISGGSLGIFLNTML